MQSAVTNVYDMPSDERCPRRRLLILERNPCVRDTCGEALERFNCDLYSTAFVENVDKVVSRFEPNAIVIDVGLFDDDGVDLLEFVANTRPGVGFLFLADDDNDLAESAEKLARSRGLRVEACLPRPVDMALLKQSLRRMAYSAQ